MLSKNMLSKNVSKNGSANVMSTLQTNFHQMDCYILHTVLYKPKIRNILLC